MSAISKLDGKVALITGASSGIGAGTAILFCRLGAKVSITGRNVDNLAETAAQCEKENGKRPLTLSGDLTKEDFVKRLVDETVKHYGKLDILVNNAGILKSGNIETTSLEQYDECMNTNVRAIYHLTMLAVPHLVNAKGNIVNVSSIAGIRSFPGFLPYCVSKSALDHFTRCTAIELAPKQVRVNSVNPGVIITDLFKTLRKNEEAYQEFLELSKTKHPLGRSGEVEEVANAIAFLASDSASFITGVQLPVDGGRNVLCP
ncbi:3-oxoacyl-[acyl-carrier-protein] reductase FabG-like [Ostrea edulis]|uniref:3-oxoacyl-[acyl-carrier-protein] reductase FabG-like n=1 Tax=Ostrea edulis TaxID=37623 RepID=UPI0024AF7F71|nr:3-oxoacyl-[acyl-carrier-protein] reductase FabG-like [Ostrea edulis]XP_056013623.1 3-oxoacyl-[acyl-carrier-protein] reductase FabG-like [Ostrea edulis]